MQATASPQGQIVGREGELAELYELLGVDSSAHALVVTGEPGIGKTTLWEAGLDRARERGLRILSARASGAETQLSFAALSDLLDELDIEEIPNLPAPQRRALEVALLRAEPAGEPPEPRAIGSGLLNALRALAARQPLLVAIDDVQWLDPPSADALAFAARRLRDDPVRFLLTKRAGTASDLLRVLDRDGLKQLRVDGLSAGAVRRLLFERLGLTLPRRVLRGLSDAAGGNPLFALELGRAIAERGLPEIGEEFEVPEAVEDLFGPRIAGLPDPLRRLLLAVALSADVRMPQLTAIAGAGPVEEAVAAGLLLVDRDRVRPSHPLLAAAARKRSPASELRELHVELARTATDEVRRAHHLALASDRDDASLAGTMAQAAATAAARGAAEDAVELAEHALRLTPEGSPEWVERLLDYAEQLMVAGEEPRLVDLLAPVVDSLPSASARVRAHLLLADGDLPHNDLFQDHYERALAESAGDPTLRATALARKAITSPVALTERIREAEAWALEALAAAPPPDAERLALHGLAWVRTLGGQSVDDLSERIGTTSDDAPPLYRSVARVLGVRFASRGEVGEARACLTRLLALADERGEARGYLVMRLHLCELALRTGEWDAAERFLDEWGESSDRELVLPPAYERCRALLATGRGDLDEAERWAAETIARSEARGERWDLLEGRRARGLAALLAHDPKRAAEDSRAVWKHTRREGIDNPGSFPVAPDLVEALVEVGERDEAVAVTERLGRLAEEQAHPWGLASAKRCRALLLEGDEAEAAMAEAVADYERLGLRFDVARSLLLLGRAQRRRKRWGAARETLELATTAFEEIGSPGWADEARSELARVGARRPRRAGELTPAEQRVVDLAVDGLSNKEIARALFVSVHTVEVHLSRAYAKLGVRSRTQLARLKV